MHLSYKLYVAPYWREGVSPFCIKERAIKDILEKNTKQYKEKNTSQTLQLMKCINSILFILTALGFRPVPSVDMTLIRFIKADPTSYSPLTDNLEAYLQCKYLITDNQ